MNQKRLVQILGAFAIAGTSLAVAYYVVTLSPASSFGQEQNSDNLECDLPAASGILNDAILRPLPSIPNLSEISGIVFWPELSSPQTKVFVAVDDRRGEAVFRILLHYEDSGPRIEVIQDTLDKALHNAEGITYLGQNRFAVVEERRQRALVIELRPEEPGKGKVRCATVPLDGGRFRELCKKGRRNDDPIRLLCNSGLEGISFDGNGKLFFVQEKLPKRLFYTDVAPLLTCDQGKSSYQNNITFPQIIEPTWVSQNNEVSDLSDLVALSNGRMFLLSQECGAIAEFDLAGNVHSAIELTASELSKVEGITWDQESRFYLVGETLSDTQSSAPFYELVLSQNIVLSKTKPIQEAE